MSKLIKKIIDEAIKKDLTLSISQGLDYDFTEVSCGKGTTFEMDDTFLFIEEHYFLLKDSEDESKGETEHTNLHLLRLADIVYIGEA